jgi:two-component sensor histidine kinase
VTPIPLAEPPEHDGAVQSWTLESYSQLSHLRSALTAAVDGEGGPGAPWSADVASAIALAGSELATNALKHAGPPATVTLRSDEHGYLIDVADCTPTALLQRPHGRGPGEGGFGLVLVTRIAEAVGWYVTDDAKHVWATFPLQARPRRTSAR